ncbi:MAG TPA: hypothetical protein VF476_04525 [Chitinophagaceae bacterium]
MSDKLKQFINDNREAFDADAPQSKLWDALQQKLEAKNKVKSFSFRKPLLWAASFAGLMILSVSIYSILQKKERGDVQESAGTETEIVELLDPIQARQISQFHEVIELKQTELKLLEKEQPELYKEFITDINSLDSSYTALKAKLPDNPNREMLLEAMINNLQLQSDLLTRQLRIIKEIKQKKYSHEKQIS